VENPFGRVDALRRQDLQRLDRRKSPFFRSSYFSRTARTFAGVIASPRALSTMAI
jgi:hypothetical protein